MILFLIVIFAAGIGVLWLLPVQENTQSAKRPEFTEPRLRVEPARNDIRDVTPEETLPGPKINKDKIVRLPDIVPPAPPKKPVKPLVLRNLIVQEAGVLLAGEMILNIAGINSLALDEKCKTANGENWPCGRFARTALRGLIGSRAIECIPIGEQINPVQATCNVGKRDLAGWLVARGWAKDANGSYADLMTKAKNANTGMWRTTRP
ncbi:MAG: hypothetical protein L3J32_11470 [Rhizobiaceae bacterium]|nr:hypothetical protein [Rhizobiaceae bacterium]